MAFDDVNSTGQEHKSPSEGRKWWTISLIMAVLLIVLVAIFLTHAA